jgi:HK97 family phage major capsid protein
MTEQQFITEEQLNEMLQEKFTALQGELDGQVKSIGDAMERVTAFLDNLPGKDQGPGYVSMDGGDDDPEVKSLGDFLVAVKRHDTKRLKSVYKTITVEDDGVIVPEDFRTELLQVAYQISPILNLVRPIPIRTGDSGRWPALDQFAAPTAGVGDSAYAGAVTADVTAEGGSYTETEPDFEQIQWRLHKVGGVVPVSNEVVTDSPMALEQLLRGLFGIAIAAKKEFFILRGTGVGQPLGILNAPAAVDVTPDSDGVFNWADALEMVSKFKPLGGQGRWTFHPSMWNDLGTMEIGTAGAAALQGNMSSPAMQSLLGYQFLQSEHLPQADNSGCIDLIDFGAYLMFEREGGLQVAYSEHAYFTTGRVGWRFDERMDGQPWLKSSITLADPQGSYTVSPFVKFND